MEAAVRTLKVKDKLTSILLTYCINCAFLVQLLQPVVQFVPSFILRRKLAFIDACDKLGNQRVDLIDGPKLQLEGIHGSDEGLDLWT